jgi:hypothetical protein
LIAHDNPVAEAARLGCTHISQDGVAVLLPMES